MSSYTGFSVDFVEKMVVAEIMKIVFHCFCFVLIPERNETLVHSKVEKRKKWIA